MPSWRSTRTRSTATVATERRPLGSSEQKRRKKEVSHSVSRFKLRREWLGEPLVISCELEPCNALLARRSSTKLREASRFTIAHHELLRVKC